MSRYSDLRDELTTLLATALTQIKLTDGSLVPAVWVGSLDGAEVQDGGIYVNIIRAVNIRQQDAHADSLRTFTYEVGVEQVGGAIQVSDVVEVLLDRYAPNCKQLASRRAMPGVNEASIMQIGRVEWITPN